MVVAVFAAIGCGKEQADASASPFCDASREWAVHELTPIDESDPKAVEAHFEDYGSFVDESLATAPSAVADDWEVYANAFRTKFMPVLEKFHFSYEEVGAKGTEEEKAIFDGAKDEQTESAFTAILTYEADVCGSQQAQPADVSFEGVKADAYCELGGKVHELIGSAIFTPAGPSSAALKKLLERGELFGLQDRQVEAAPDVIRADVEKFVAFEKSEHRDVIAKYDYDLSKLILSGTQHDREIYQYTDASIRESSTRIDAFEQQVCG
jgi:hypothetical protein